MGVCPDVEDTGTGNLILIKLILYPSPDNSVGETPGEKAKENSRLFLWNNLEFVLGKSLRKFLDLFSEEFLKIKMITLAYVIREEYHKRDKKYQAKFLPPLIFDIRIYACKY